MIHLHTRSRYSLLEATLDIDEIVSLAKEAKQSSVALSDHRTMFATMPFLHAAKAAGLKPIVGLEFEMDFEGRPFAMLLIARNTAGLQNLYALSTRLMSSSSSSASSSSSSASVLASSAGPVLPVEDLKDYSAGCFVLSGGGDDQLLSFCTPKSEESLRTFLQTIQSQCEPDSFYVSMSLHDSSVFRDADRYLKQVCRSMQIPTVALTRIAYRRREDERIARLLAAIGASKHIDDPALNVRSGRFFRNTHEMEVLYDQEDLENTDRIAAQIEDYDIPKASLPQFVNKASLSSEDYLRRLCQAGLNKRLGRRRIPEYEARLERELSVITSMGFADYFLIVYDFIREARKRNILVGPGRGSAAGSLVSWVLGISHIDPIANGLLFERFLNPERISMPDIDTDFPDNRRDEIFDYVQELYGRYHVAHIVTFSRMKAKAALRDCARALGVPARDVSKLTALIPSGPNAMSLQEVYVSNQAFASYINTSAELARLFEAAKSIENFPRHTSTHAGGVVLARDPIYKQAPLLDDGGPLPVVQFSMEYLEEIGLIKFDFLALRNLSLLADIVDCVEKAHGVHIDLLRLPLNDPAVFKLLQRGDTLGIFQLESAGIRKLISRFVPRCFEDIAAILALYRPGPMKSIDTYLNARFHPESRKSIHPLIDRLLEPTGGIFLYQEQIMEAARILGGFSLAQADILRKAMSKKKRDVMESWKARFIEGAAKQNIDAKEASHIFEIMEEFADYGFNKSHSYAYALIVYQLAYLKAHDPLQFYLSLLRFSGGSSIKTYSILQEARSRGIQTLPVSLNFSQEEFALEKGGIRLPLTLVRTFGRAGAKRIIEERNTYGAFDDPILSVLRLSRLKFSNEQIAMLVQIGALDETGVSRESLLDSLDEILRLVDLAMLDASGKHWILAGVSKPQLRMIPVNVGLRLSKEQEVLGFSISAHPATALRAQDRRLMSARAASEHQGFLQMAGFLGKIREHKTKKGDLMAYTTLSDETGNADLAIVPKTYKAVQAILKENAYVRIEGKRDEKGSIAVFAMSLIPLQPLPTRAAGPNRQSREGGARR